jgi:hypothetical protein
MKPAYALGPSIADLARTLCFTCIFYGAAVGQGPSIGIRVEGPGSPPQIGFASCDRGVKPMQSLFADPDVIAHLSKLHAEIAIAIVDFTPQRADVVRRLNQAGIPVIAWMLLPE